MKVTFQTRRQRITAGLLIGLVIVLLVVVRMSGLGGRHAGSADTLGLIGAVPALVAVLVAVFRRQQ